MSYLERNTQLWNTWSQEGKSYTRPISHEAFVEARERALEIYLTPQKPVPLEWFDGHGKRVLGLASGGGQQGPVLVAHGYDVTIMDFAASQLDSEHLVAEREGYGIQTVQADMTQPFPFADECFDIIVNPVSNCYIEDLTNTWRECFRVLRPGGALMVGYANPIIYMFSDEDVWDSDTAPMVCKYPLPYNARELEQKGLKADSTQGYQFSHTLEAQLRGQLRAGFVIHDLYESNDLNCRLSEYTNLYLANLAIKPTR